MSLDHILSALRNLAVLLLIGANTTAAQPAQPNHGRPIVLLVHGRGQFGRDTAELRREAVLAIQQSVSALTGNALVADDDVRLVWYADVLDAREHEQSDICAIRATGSPSKSDTLVNAVTMFASLASAFFDVGVTLLFTQKAGYYDSSPTRGRSRMPGS